MQKEIKVRGFYEYKGHTYKVLKVKTSKQDEGPWVESVDYVNVINGKEYNRDLKGFLARFKEVDNASITIQNLIDSGFRKEVEEGINLLHLVFKEEEYGKEVVMLNVNSNAPECIIYDSSLEEVICAVEFSEIDSVEDLKLLLKKVKVHDSI